jgi:hypothetical protein
MCTTWRRWSARLGPQPLVTSTAQAQALERALLAEAVDAEAALHLVERRCPVGPDRGGVGGDTPPPAMTVAPGRSCAAPGALRVILGPRAVRAEPGGARVGGEEHGDRRRGRLSCRGLP